MSRPRIALFGGSGFVGTVLANQLVRADYGVRIFTRDRQHARALWLLPDTDVIELEVADEERVAQALVGCTAAVNLIGILNERRDNGVDFHRAHVETVEHLIKACKHARVPHLLHMSALKAGPQAPSRYLRSKGEAEKRLHSASGRQFRSTVLRPSVIFGRHDHFLNRFAALLKRAPHLLPLTACETRLQPIYVGDVVAAILALLRATPSSGSTVINVTRYGNVMCSRGSVIPLFTQQILQRGAPHRHQTLHVGCVDLLQRAVTFQVIAHAVGGDVIGVLAVGEQFLRSLCVGKRGATQ